MSYDEASQQNLRPSSDSIMDSDTPMNMNRRQRFGNGARVEWQNGVPRMNVPDAKVPDHSEIARFHSMFRPDNPEMISRSIAEVRGIPPQTPPPVQGQQGEMRRRRRYEQPAPQQTPSLSDMAYDFYRSR